jgi:phthalate 4,5-dioxygenase
VEKGAVPPGIDPEHHKRSAAIVLPRDQPYKDAAAEHLRVRAGSAHVSV